MKDVEEEKKVQKEKADSATAEAAKKVAVATAVKKQKSG